MYVHRDPAAIQYQTGAEPSQQALDPRYARQVVSYSGREAPGTIVIDTPQRYLYLVQPGGQAIRYGIGVGRPGFTWAGVKSVTRKAEWPDWRPPAEMLKRRPDLPQFMAGGPDNPLGARAMYLGSSLYRIHGSNEPWTIGTAVSSGCIRMRNEDVTDLYERVKVGTKVIVI
jgi:lipoprotein-anchoring transpeptidase ErfK/SrfK